MKRFIIIVFSNGLQQFNKFNPLHRRKRKLILVNWQLTKSWTKSKKTCLKSTPYEIALWRCPVIIMTWRKSRLTTMERASSTELKLRTIFWVVWLAGANLQEFQCMIVETVGSICVSNALKQIFTSKFMQTKPWIHSKYRHTYKKNNSV